MQRFEVVLLNADELNLVANAMQDKLHLLRTQANASRCNNPELALKLVKMAEQVHLRLGFASNGCDPHYAVNNAPPVD